MQRDEMVAFACVCAIARLIRVDSIFDYSLRLSFVYTLLYKEKEVNQLSGSSQPSFLPVP